MRSSLIALYLRTVPPGTSASRQALLDALEQQIGHRTAENALVSLANTLDCTPLGADLGLGIVTRKGNACVEITREKRVSVPPEALLYALYRYAETMDQYALSLDQIANDTEAGPAHWFGSNAADLDAALRGLSSQHPSLLRTEFARGLDSVFLAPELSAVDALRAVVR